MDDINQRNLDSDRDNGNLYMDQSKFKKAQARSRYSGRRKRSQERRDSMMSEQSVDSDLSDDALIN